MTLIGRRQKLYSSLLMVLKKSTNKDHMTYLTLVPYYIIQGSG